MSRKKQREKAGWVDPSVLYTRQDIAERTGLSDEVLSYWIKRKLLVPEGEAAGKGIHLRFHYSQVSIAVVLKALRDHFGANIGTLQSLADMLQRGCQLFRRTKAPVSAWSAASHLAERLARFRSGERFKVMFYDDDAEDVIQKVVETESDVIQETLTVRDDDPSVIMRLAEMIGPGRRQDFEIALALLGTPIDPRYSDGAWLLANTDHGWVLHANIENAIEDNRNVGPSMFLPVSRMVRRPWDIPSSGMLRALDASLRIEASAADYGFDVRVTVLDEEGSARFEGKDADNPQFELFVERWRAPDHWIERAGLEPIRDKHDELYWTPEIQRERAPK